MNELRRMQYLRAMGVDGYVSRTQLPGAAPTRRLALVMPIGPGVPVAANPEGSARPVAKSELPAISNSPKKARPSSRKPREARPAVPVVRFSLAAFVAGDILWVEELGAAPLAREQSQLVYAMARAVAPDVERPGLATQFDWPIHNNQQLDQGEEAARAGLAGFLTRLIEEHGCRALVVLGDRCEPRLASGHWPELTRVVTLSTRDMLADPASKRLVWSDLQVLLRKR